MTKSTAKYIHFSIFAGIILALLEPAPLPAQTNGLYYLRLQVELETTAKRAAFGFSDASMILTSRMIEARGPLSNKEWTLRRFWLRSAQAGAMVSAIAVFALSEHALSGPLPFSLEKSEEGDSRLRVSVIDRTGAAHFIREWRHTGSDRLEDAIDLSASAANAATLSSSLLPLWDMPGSGAAQKMLLAFYYLWYELGDWGSPYLQDQPAAPYSSSDPAALARHVELAQSVGIGGFLASWWGPDNAIDRNFAMLLDAARDKDFKVGLYFETMDATGPRDEDTILSWLRYALSRYKDHPAFLKVNDRPVVVVWVSFAVPLEVWDRVFRELRAGGLDAVFIGAYDEAEPPLSVLDVFDGLHTYNLLGIIDSNNEVPDILPLAYEETGRAVRYYSLLSGPAKIWTATIQPGFDDTLLPGRSTPVLSRQAGGLYQASWQAATASRPDWILITTWNEWWENTHIEPSRLYDDFYLRMTGDLYRAWKTKAGEPPF